MSYQAIQVDSPLKGVSRAFSREKQPDGTCYDALNVLPLERWGRLRVGQRSGIAGLEGLENADPVRVLHVASTVGTIAGSTPTTTLLTETFTYGDGDLGATAAWNTYDENDVAQTDAFAIVSNQVTTGAGDYTNPYALGQTAITLGTDYDITVTFTMGVSAPGQFYQFALFSNFDDEISDFTVVRAVFTIPRDGTATGGITLVSENGSDFQANPVLTVSTTHTATLRVRGTAITALIDGVQVAAITETSPLAFDGAGSYGLRIDGNDPTLDPVTFDNFIVTTPDPVEGSISRTILKLVATAGADTFVGDPVTMTKATASATFPINDDALFVSAATLFGVTYIVDGSNIRKLDLLDNTMKTFTASAGTPPTGCDIAAAWRGRLVLAGNSAEPQNFYASRSGDPLDWDYAETDPAAAFAGNSAASGKVGAPIHALIPMSDDILLIGLEQAIYAVKGDPADTGSIDLVSDTIGISSATSWAKGPDGSVYFVGPRGFYKIGPAASGVEDISRDSYPQFFQSINRKTAIISCLYDPDRFGIWVYVTPEIGNIAGTHIFYDLRNGGFWPQQFGEVDAGPVSAIFWDGYSTDTRYPVLGGFDGVLYVMNLTNRTDDGQDISSLITLGPIHPGIGDNVLTATTINFGELSAADDAASADRWNANVQVESGKTPYDVTDGTPTGKFLSGTGRDRRTKTFRQRLRGEWFTLTLSNGAAGNYFTFESAVLEFDTKGRNRRQR